MNKIVGGSWPLLAFYFNIFCHYAICSNKNAFQWDAYRPLQWPSRGRGKESAWGCLPGGVHPPTPVDRQINQSKTLLTLKQNLLLSQTGLNQFMDNSQNLPLECLGGCTPAPCGQTDACENITFPQLLLRTVNMCT